jgi:translation initiation factor 2 subunit 1
MLYQKEGMPEEGELVLCTVTSVQSHSVFVRIDEYGKSGMIHISEISPGRIRNIRDYVVEGKVVVCKVLKINMERGHIDLSLRRVSEGQRREKVNEIKQEQKAEKIIEFVARSMKITKDELFTRIQENIFKNYPTVYSVFEEVINDDKVLENIGIPKGISDKLVELIKQRIKPPEVILNGKVKVFSYEPDGVERVKKILLKIEGFDEEINISYLGGGLYSFSIRDSDYKSAEKKLKSMIEEIDKLSSKQKVHFEFERTGGKAETKA